MTRHLSVALTGKTDITFTRQFNASRALVWRAMTDPALLPRWMYTAGVPLTTCEQEFRIGGTLRWVWTRPDGSEMGMRGRYLEIDAPVWLVNTEVFDEDWTGGETVVTMVLSEVGPQLTRMDMVVRYASTAGRDGAASTEMAEGMDESYARLDGLLPVFLAEVQTSDFRLVAEGADRLVMTRSFAAPLAAVMRAHLEPALVQRWMGSPTVPMTGCIVDARVGGSFRYVWQPGEGAPVSVTGTFLEIGTDRMVHTETFDPDWTGGEARVVTRFAETGGRTTVRTEVTYSGPAARDAVQASGMAEGMAGSYDQLERLLDD